MFIECNVLQINSNLTLYHAGPSFKTGPLASVFYFSLSGYDSLTKNPFNQFVQFLHGKNIRIFSLTLPYHQEGLNPKDALQAWSQDVAKNHNLIDSFLTEFEEALLFGIQNELIDPTKVAVAGLSRGGFIAMHAAARSDLVKTALAFAPVSQLGSLPEFSEIKDFKLTQSLNLENIASKLCNKNILIHIGNVDLLVDTKLAFDFAFKTASLALDRGIRSPQVTLITHPSIGHKGHGTPEHIFRQGSEWISAQLQID